MNTYAHVLPNTQRQAVEEIDKLLGDVAGAGDGARDDEAGKGEEGEEATGD